MMIYSALLKLHALTVVVSLSLFLLRCYWLLREAPQLQRAWLRWLPHSNDTLLIAAAVGMVVTAELNPFEQPWLLAKIIGLLVYISLGMIALHGTHSRATRIQAMLAALLVFAYLVSVAVSKQVLPGLG